MNWYYTPELEEFHIGFEYERLNSYQNEYEELIYEGNIGSKDLQKYINDIRVKYLNEEDIQDILGIENVGNGIDLKFVWSKSNVTYYEFEYNVLIKTLYVTRCATIDYIDDVIIFEGTIKNKSELKKLLKQLDVV